LFVAVQHVAYRLLLAGDDEIAGDEAEQDEKATADKLIAPDRAIGDDGIVALPQRFELGCALHELPLLRRFLA
jgi:hypothetical protein